MRRVESRYDRAGGGSASPATAARNRLISARCPLSCDDFHSRRFPPRWTVSTRKSSSTAADAPAERLEPLLRQPGIAAAGVDERCRPRSAKRMWAVKLSLHSIGRPGCGTATAWRRHRGRAGQVGEQVDEVAALAEQPSAAVLGIVEPVVVGERARVDAHGEHEVVDLSELRLQPLDERGEAAVEARP